MKKIILSCIFLLFWGVSTAQWTAIDSVKTNAIWLIAPDDGWSFGKDFKHWDGTSWVTAVQDSAFIALTCAFPSPNSGWVFGIQDSLYRFNGSVWTKQFSGMPYIGYCDFTDSLNGWVLSPMGVSYRYDNGIWNQYNINLPAYIQPCYYQSISSCDPNTVWIAASAIYDYPATDSSYFIRFVNNQWIIDTALPDIYFYTICFTDPNHGWAGGLDVGNGYQNVIYRYDGQGWSLESVLGGYDGVGSIYMYSNNLGWASVSANADFFIYVYDGFSWSLQDSLHWPVKQFSFTDPMNGWALGINTGHPNHISNIIFETSSGGFGIETHFDINSKDIIVFPNPTSTSFSVQLPPTFGTLEKLEIFNSVGQMVRRYKTVENVDMSGYPQGLYFVVVTGESGERVTGRVVKE